MSFAKRWLVALAVLLLAHGQPLSGVQGRQDIPPATPHACPVPEAAPPLRIFVISDVHVRRAPLERVIADVERERPDVVLDAGDYVHDGTEAEFMRAHAQRSRFAAPLHVAPGNHDVVLRGPFQSDPPAFPALQSIALDGARVILLDNADGVLGAALLERLEAELAAAAEARERVLLVMHVPAFTTRPTLAARLRHLLPFRLANPVMTDPAEVARFIDLVQRQCVLAVLAGHTHAFEHVERGGVHFITAGTTGGLLPGPGVAHEYLDIRVDGRVLDMRRIRLSGPARDPITLIVRSFAFFRELNGTTHALQGWQHTPTTSVQLRGGVLGVERDGTRAAAHGTMAFERVLGGGFAGLTGELVLVAGERDLLAGFALGGRVRPAGDFNRGIYAGASGTAGAGLLAGRGRAGVGLRLSAGAERDGWTAELLHDRATHLRAFGLLIGRRY